MPNVILVSSDANITSRCSQRMAQQLLHQGLAKITKFYPYTIQFKKGKPFNPFEPTSQVNGGPKGPLNQLYRAKKRKNLEVLYE